MRERAFRRIPEFQSLGGDESVIAASSLGDAAGRLESGPLAQ